MRNRQGPTPPWAKLVRCRELDYECSLGRAVNVAEVGGKTNQSQTTILRAAVYDKCQSRTKEDEWCWQEGREQRVSWLGNGEEEFVSEIDSSEWVQRIAFSRGY